jgi:hypothetical protein
MFGVGLALGFADVVIGGDPRLERAASALMAVGLMLLPLALFADGRGIVLIAWLAARLSRRRRGKKRKAGATSRSPRAARGGTSTRTRPAPPRRARR